MAENARSGHRIHWYVRREVGWREVVGGNRAVVELICFL